VTNFPRVAASSTAALALLLTAGAHVADAHPADGRPAGAGPADARPAGVRPGGSGPLQLTLRPAVGSINSLNSAGYAVSHTRTRFRSVRATFFVPYLNCGLSKGARSSQWVGLDGFVGAPDSVEQDGIEADCSSAGRSSFHAWYAMYPRPRTTPKIAIRSGDSVTARISYDLADTTFSLALTNNTTGGHFAVRKKCPHGVRCPRNSAEVITSAPAAGTAAHLRISPLADYGAVSYTAISIVNRAGQSGGLRSARWSATRIIQTEQAAPFRLIARPTPIGAGTFDNYWARAS
jgi:Peptidase A4 family